MLSTYSLLRIPMPRLRNAITANSPPRAQPLARAVVDRPFAIRLKHASTASTGGGRGDNRHIRFGQILRTRPFVLRRRPCASACFVSSRTTILFATIRRSILLRVSIVVAQRSSIGRACHARTSASCRPCGRSAQRIENAVRPLARENHVSPPPRPRSARSPRVEDLSRPRPIRAPASSRLRSRAAFRARAHASSRRRRSRPSARASPARAHASVAGSRVDVNIRRSRSSLTPSQRSAL